MKKIIVITTLIFNLVVINVFSFDFLINMFFGILPQPVRSAFKGQGLVNNQLSYGFGNSAFTTIGHLNSELNFEQGNFVDKYKFKNPTYYTYAGYIAHVSTPVFFTVYPGWQLELEVGYGGTDYDPSTRELTQKFYFSGMSGFNWNIYQSPKIKKYSLNLNLGFGYKLHSFLKEELYYNTQIGLILVPNVLSTSVEYLTTAQGGTFFIYGGTINKSKSKEQMFTFSINWLLKEKSILKLGSVIKNWHLTEIMLPNRETKTNFYGIFLSLLTK
ncbi:MAG: hypothetical protein SNJ64_02915 [Endomicrobiia bacterium]